MCDLANESLSYFHGGTARSRMAPNKGKRCVLDSGNAI